MQQPLYPPNLHTSAAALRRNPAGLRFLLLTCLLALGALSSAWATHYRYGSLTWRTVSTDATRRTIELRVSNSFRRSFFAGSPVVGSVVNNVGSLAFGDNTSAPINLKVTSVDAAADIFYGEYTVTHVYPAGTAPINYTAFYTSNARVSTLVNNADQPWYIKSLVNVGTNNSSPVSTLPPVVNLATNQAAATFQLPANDPDGDPLTYALATRTDMGNITFTNAPGLTVNATTGVVKFNTTGLAVDKLYNAVILVSDGKTSILVDFIIKVTRVSAAPQFDYSITPTNGHLYQVAPGTTVAFGVRATDSDAGDIVNLQGIGLPPGSVMSPALPATGNPVTSQFSWTPTINTLGTSVITFVAQDAVGVQTTSSVTIQVSTKPTFDVPPTPSNGSYTQIVPGTTVSQLVQVSSIDPNSPVRLLSAAGLPGATYAPALPTAAANPTSTTLTWTPVLADWGPHTATFVAANSYNDQKTHSFDYVVNSAPAFTSVPGTLDVVAGRPFHYSITTTDPDLPYGDELEIEHPGLPAWLTVTDNGDGTASLDGTPTVAEAGANPVTLVAADIYHHGASYGLITQSFSINVIPCSAQALAHDVALTLNASGQATLTAAQVDNGSTATCGIASLTVSPASFSCANIGANPVTLTLTDNYGNVSTATATVTLTDGLAPTAVAKNLTVTLDANGQVSVTAAQLNDGSRDNCGVATLALDKTSFDCSSLGDNAVTLTVTDASGNASTATATVTVQSALAVALTSTNSGCYNAKNGSSSAAVTGGTAATYAWTGPNGFSAATASISNLAPGAYSLTVTTAGGCTASASTTITEPANFAPQANADQLTTTACKTLVITPAMLLGNDTDPQNQALQVAEVLNPTNGTIVSNANGTFTFTPTAGFTGAATFRYVAKKNDNTVAYSGNGHFYEYIASNNITWSSANSAASARTYQGLRGYLATITSAGENAFAAAKLQGNGWIGASDAQTEGNWKWVTGPEAGQQFWQGLSNGYRVNSAYVNWQGGEPNNAGDEDYAHFYSGRGTWNDFPNYRPGEIQGYVVEYGGLESCLPVLTSAATVTVNVTPVAPTALARNLTVALNANGTATITAAQINNNSTAACAITALNVAPSTFSCANTGPNAVTLTVTDASGLSSTATAVVTVIDNTRPTITAPANVAVSADAGQCTASGVALGTATAADNCSATVTSDAPATFAKGLTTVTWTATDASGNTATATQTVTVNDTEKPTISAPAAVVASTDADQCTATSVALGNATAADNCSGVVVTNDAPATFAKGTTTVLWTATDAAGNVSTATQTVTVNDTQRPTIAAPAAVVASTDAGECSATSVALGNAAAGDNCPGVVVSNDAPATFAKGTTTVTWTATDAAGNVATATQTVTVNDTERPLIAAPAAVTVSTDRGQCSATNVALGNSVAKDNCGATVTNDAPAAFAKGTTTVTWTATDAAGNTATATQLVTVNDTEQPVLTVPANIIANAPATQCGAAVSFAPTATDNCAGATVVASPASGSTFPVGTSTVIVTATDASGNVSTGSFTVTVKDVTAPAVAVRNVTVTLVNGAASVTAADVNNNSTDACGIASYRLNRSAFTCANLGANPVVLTVTDIHGNVASAPATVTVVGSIPTPAIAVTPASSVNTGGVPTNLYLGYGSQSATLTAKGGVSYVWSPAAGLSSTTVANPVFTATTAGTFTYTVTATNQYGCTATATVTLRVVDARCGNKNDKVVVCHNGHEICISPNAVPAHLDGHAGDQLGACGTATRSAAPAPTAEAALATELVFEAYPNPFGASTTVHFRPTVSAPAQIRVYDAVGRVVGTLFSGTTEAGHDYALTLDGTSLAAGLYLCRYESQGQVHTQRLSVVK